MRQICSRTACQRRASTFRFRARVRMRRLQRWSCCPPSHWRGLVCAGSWPATPRRRSVLLLFGFNFTGFGERAILTTHQGPSPDAVRSPAHLYLLPCLPCPAFAHYRPILTACHRCNSIEAGGAESAQVVCRGSSSSSSSSSAELAACEGGEALRTRCATRPSHTPV